MARTRTRPDITIAYITHVNAQDRTIFSGTPYYVSYYLDTWCGNVKYIDNLIPDRMTPGYLLKNFFGNRALLLMFEIFKSKLLALFGKQADWRMSRIAARHCARQIKPRLDAIKCDLIWVEKSCVSLRYLATDIPIIYESDATFQAMVGYYPWFSNLTKNALLVGNEIERSALQKAAAVALTADWAKESAINDYGIEPDKIHILPSPPNWDKQPDRKSVLKEKPSDVCNFLFVGVDWLRKGGDIAFTAVEHLNRTGVNAKLTVCGCTPPENIAAKSFVDVIGYLDKNNKNDLVEWERLFHEANFFFLPTRAECMGISFSEAMAFGLPLLATDTGGVSTVVKHELNGLLFSYDENPETMAHRIADLWNDRKKYRSMRIESRRFFDEHISGEAWAKVVNGIISKITNDLE